MDANGFGIFFLEWSNALRLDFGVARLCEYTKNC